jgi:TRAP-type C4-dicarboxylate transport system permease small subunit
MKAKNRDHAVFLRNLVGIVFLVIIILTISQVFFRFVLDSPLIWSEELVRFLLIWMTMLGSAVLCYDDAHLAIGVIVDMLPPKAKVWTDMFNKAVILLMLLATVYYSPKLIRASYHTSSGALDIPFAYWRAAAPVGCALMAIYTIYRLGLDFHTVQAEKAGHRKPAEEGKR